jgi:glycosyltransferase involved in cell wall biosynthesis
MNILLINHYAGSPEMGMEFRPYYLAQQWISQGHKVSVLAASHSHIRAHNPSINSPFEIQDLNGVQYLWIKTASYEGNGIGRVKNIVQFLRACNKYQDEIIKVSSPDLVIASSTYPADNYISKRIAKKCKAQHFYEVHDLWPLSPIELGGMSKWHPFILWMQMAENYAYRKADKVISMLPKTMEHMKAHGMEESKWRYIPNGFLRSDWDSPAVLNQETNTAIKGIRNQYKYILAYTGTFGLANALDVIFDASIQLKSMDVAIVLVGTGPEKNRLEQRIENEGLENVFILNSVSKDQVPDLLSQFDILYIGLLYQKLFRFGISPNKLIDYMMASKPIIKSIDSGNDPVKESGCGVSIEPENYEEVIRAVKEILSLTLEERIEMGKRGRDFAEQNHDYAILASKFIAIAEGKA